MVTFTNKETDPNKVERIPQIGNKPKLFLGRDLSNTSFFPRKKYIVLSARVHPSEVASSYVLRSFVRYMLKERKQDAKK